MTSLLLTCDLSEVSTLSVDVTLVLLPNDDVSEVEAMVAKVAKPKKQTPEDMREL